MEWGCTVVDKPDLTTLQSATRQASIDARRAGLDISRPDFLDMNDGKVSVMDKALADTMVGLITGYLDEGSVTHWLTRRGLTSLPKDLARERAREMLVAARDLQAAVNAQYDGQSLTARMWENAKDSQVRTGVVGLVRDLVRSDSDE